MFEVCLKEPIGTVVIIAEISMNGIIQTKDLGLRLFCFPDEVTFITHSFSTSSKVADCCVEKFPVSYCQVTLS